ncbi:hypothetical protein P2N83_10700, partial [Escherichia coli]
MALFSLASFSGRSDCKHSSTNIIHYVYSFSFFGRNDRTAYVTLHACMVVSGSDSNLLIVFYVQIMPDDLVMQLHR